MLTGWPSAVAKAKPTDITPEFAKGLKELRGRLDGASMRRPIKVIDTCLAAGKQAKAAAEAKPKQQARSSKPASSKPASSKPAASKPKPRKPIVHHAQGEDARTVAAATSLNCAARCQLFRTRSEKLPGPPFPFLPITLESKKCRFELHPSLNPLVISRKPSPHLSRGVTKDNNFQVLEGVTGSGKTLTLSNVIQAAQLPTLIIVHNKTLVRQLQGNSRSDFPSNAVHAFLSCYDEFQPGNYNRKQNRYIEQDGTNRPGNLSRATYRDPGVADPHRRDHRRQCFSNLRIAVTGGLPQAWPCGFAWDRI